MAKIGDKAAGQSALESLAKIAEEKGRPAEPFLVSAFPKILEAPVVFWPSNPWFCSLVLFFANNQS